MESFGKGLSDFLQYSFPAKTQEMINIVLLWFGYALIVGIIARFLVPGQRNKGAFATLLIGLTGSCIGPLLLTSFGQEGKTFNPVSPPGFIISVISSIVALILFQMSMLLFPPKSKEKEQEKE